jgi:hypothetical protein
MLGLKPGAAFDASGSSKVLLQLLQEKNEKNAAAAAPSSPSALVPGCGRGYDVIEMAKVGDNTVCVCVCV